MTTSRLVPAAYNVAYGSRAALIVQYPRLKQTPEQRKVDDRIALLAGQLTEARRPCHSHSMLIAWPLKPQFVYAVLNALPSELSVALLGHRDRLRSAEAFARGLELDTPFP